MKQDRQRRTYSAPWFFWLAQKYLLARSQTHGGSSLWLAVLGIGIGVAALISVLTGMNGMQSLLTDSIEELTAYHLQVISRDTEISDQLLEYLYSIPEISNVTPYQESPMLLNSPYGTTPHIAIVRAVVPEAFSQDEGRKRIMQNFGMQEDFDLNDPSSILLGLGFSYQFSIAKGDHVSLISIGGDSNIALTPVQREFVVSSLYQVSNPNIDKNYVFIGYNNINKKLFYGSNIYYGIKLYNKSDAYTIKLKLIKDLALFAADKASDPYSVRTGRESNQAFFTALRTEKMVLQFLVSLIFLVVAFQIYQSIHRSVFNRTQELMLLRALGASTNEIQIVFLLEGMFVGLLGIILGGITGVFLSMHLNEILLFISHIILRSTSLLPEIQARVWLSDFLLVVGSAILFSTLAGWLASRQLAQANPIKILRNE